jgi:peptide/nickel transport system permease protein
MLRFLLGRIASMAFVFLMISIFVFLIFFAIPGLDPAARIAGRGADPATLALVRSSFGLDQPLPVQYLIMMKKIFITHDLTSFVNRGQEVIPQILAAAPVTLSLVLGAAVIWVVFAMLMGVTAAANQGRWIDPALVALGMLLLSIPPFWLGEMANLVTQSRWHDGIFSWVPPLGYVSFGDSPSQWALHLVIPWFVLAVGYIGLYGRILRSSVVDAYGEDFIRTAKAKGLSGPRVMIKHAVRTSMLVFVSLFGLDFAALLGGSALLIEVVFGLPGIGKLTYDSLLNFDLPVIMGTVLYAAFFVVVLAALVDVAYAFLDPRVRRV